MKKKILAVASATLMLSSVAGVSAAHHQDGHDANNHGLCTAYFSGSENGQGNKRDNGSAFGAFANGIADSDGDGDTDAYDIARFCNEAIGGFGNPGGGNDAFFGDSNCPDDAGDCEELENQPGGTDGDGNNSNSGNNGGGQG